jgi:hypothetical protein
VDRRAAGLHQETRYRAAPDDRVRGIAQAETNHRRAPLPAEHQQIGAPLLREPTDLSIAGTPNEMPSSTRRPVSADGRSAPSHSLSRWSAIPPLSNLFEGESPRFRPSRGRPEKETTRRMVSRADALAAGSRPARTACRPASDWSVAARIVLPQGGFIHPSPWVQRARDILPGSLHHEDAMTVTDMPTRTLCS